MFGLAMGFVAGFAGPGYEIALVTGIVMPSVVAVAVAQELARSPADALTPFDALSRGAAIGTGASAMTLAATLFHGLLKGFCDLFSGLQVVVLGPGIGLVLAGVAGWAASELSRYVPLRARAKRPGRRRAVSRVVLALAFPIGGIVISLWRYYTSPMIFAYDPFAGYFSGTIYDTVIEFTTLATYRLGSAATLLFTTLGALHLARDDQGRARPRWIGRPGVTALAAAGLVASAWITLEGSSLGHWSTRASIERELGGKMEGERCIVVYARSIDHARVVRFAEECEGHVAIDEAWWGARGPEKITAFFFADESQKGKLMGASGTNIAKPWRAEVYVQDQDFPHRVIGHELMHVIAASDGEGPFAIGGDWGGFLPNPGLIEGVATAGSPKEDDLSPAEWAKAMKDLDILPPLASLFALGFVGENASMAYTVAGAFIGWMHDRYGADSVRAWYRGKTLEQATGKGLVELETEWLEVISAIELPESASIVAKAKFDRPGFFARRCPRRVDECREKAETLTVAGDMEGALAQISEARRWEGKNPTLRLDEAAALVAGGEVDRGLSLYREISADQKIPTFVRDKAIEELSDQSLKRGDIEAAKSGYEELLARTLDESKLRTLYVKLEAVRDPVLRPAVVTLLLGQGKNKPDRVAAAALLGVLDQERPDDGLAAYLLGRYFIDQADYEGAQKHFERALSRKLSVPRVRIEALRLRMVAAAALGDCASLEQTLKAYEEEPGVNAARVDAAKRLFDLCKESGAFRVLRQSRTP